MNVRWSRDAERDRSDIFDFISAEAFSAAKRMDALFGATADRLAKFPAMGRPGALPGTRECLPHRHNRLIYEVAADTIFIIALVQTSRQWPPDPISSLPTR